MRMHSAGYVWHSNGKLEHVVVVERAIGKTLPKGSDVHHINGIRADNRKVNLVVCPSHAYHELLHYRQRALEKSRDANNVKCVYCKKFGLPETMYVRQRSRAGIEARHRACHAAAVLAAKRMFHEGGVQ